MCDKHQHDAHTETLAANETRAATEVPAAAGPQASGGCCGGHSTQPAAPATANIHTAPAATSDAPADDVAECPVMPGSLVNKADAEAAGLFSDHNGERYWFCCAACGPMWDADPAKYAA